MSVLLRQVYQWSYASLHVSFSLLGLQSFPHPERHAAFVQRLVGGDRHVNLVSDPQQQQTPLRAVDGHLSDELI